jgi:PAS domain-containing protein
LPKFDPDRDIDPAAVIEAAAESILVTTTDLDAPGPSIVYVNPAFERMTGWSRADVLGKSPRILQGPNTDLRIFDDLSVALHTKNFLGRSGAQLQKGRLRILDGVVHCTAEE